MARRGDGQVMLGVFNVDRAEAVASCKRLATLDAEVACFGHGEPLTQGAAAELRAVADQLPNGSCGRASAGAPAGA